MNHQEPINVYLERTIEIDGEEYDASMELSVARPSHSETWLVNLEILALFRGPSLVTEDAIWEKAHTIIKQEIKPDGRFYEEALQKAFI